MGGGGGGGARTKRPIPERGNVSHLQLVGTSRQAADTPETLLTLLTDRFEQQFQAGQPLASHHHHRSAPSTAVHRLLRWSAPSTAVQKLLRWSAPSTAVQRLLRWSAYPQLL